MRFFENACAFLKKHKEIVLYVFFGGLTTLISILSFVLLYDILEINEHFANIISWIFAVTFAFITNRKWVFADAIGSKNAFFKQMLEFYAGRLFSLGVEEVVIFVFITLLSFNALLTKLATQFMVLLLNYFISKFWVFKPQSQNGRK